MITVRDVHTPTKVTPTTPRRSNLILQEKQEILFSELFEGKNNIEINVNNYYCYYLPKMNDSVGMMGILLSKNKDTILKGKPIKITLDQTLVPAFERYLNFIAEKRSFIPEYSVREAVEHISDLCRFGTPLKLAVNHVSPEAIQNKEKMDEILEMFVRGMTSLLLNSIMLFDDKKDCKTLLVPVLLRNGDDNSVLTKLKLWLEMSIVRSRHSTVGFTGDSPQTPEIERIESRITNKSNHPRKLNHYVTCQPTQPKRDLFNYSNAEQVSVSAYFSKKEYRIEGDQMVGIKLLQAAIRGHETRKLFDLNNILKRKQCVFELVQTEQNLHANMKLMNQYFLEPINNKQKDKLFKKKVSNVFLTLTRCISSSAIFVEKLKDIIEHYKVDTCIGNALQMLLPYVAPYLNFTTDYQISLATWKELKRSSLVQEVLKSNLGVKELENQTLESLLIQPVQRVMRYPMLIKEIIKLTSKEHPDYYPLKEAFREFHFFSTIANERSKMRDSLQQVSKELGDEELLVDNRYHLWTGDVISKNESKVYLFNDVIMVCVKQKNGRWVISETMQIGGDVEVFVVDKTVTIKKYRYAKPMIFELENSELCIKFKTQVEEIIRDDWFNLSDERSWIDLIDRKNQELSSV